MLTNETVEVITEVPAEVSENLTKKRLERYMEKMENKPKLCNQILIYPGEVIVRTGGSFYRCDSIEGYIKFPEKDCFQAITLLDKPLVIALLSNYKLLIKYDDKIFCRGYKKLNTEGLVLIMKVVLENMNGAIFLVDTGKGEINPYFSLEDIDAETGMETNILYDSFVSIIKDTSKFDMVDVEEDDDYEEEE